ncbi:hypothetical protein [Gryllotalpicola koreensis]|uniref:Uncharacterized protein n=1 Tax=Gryllotalpicola koreensis TaxID=993086 RepID=A0ABP8A6M5_9MICO
MIKLDSTQISTVVLCTECPWWHGFADTKDEGWKVGARHEQAIHGRMGNTGSTTRVQRFRQRRAEKRN